MGVFASARRTRKHGILFDGMHVCLCNDGIMVEPIFAMAGFDCNRVDGRRILSFADVVSPLDGNHRRWRALFVRSVHLQILEMILWLNLIPPFISRFACKSWQASWRWGMTRRWILVHSANC